MGLDRLSKLGLKVPENFVRDAFSIPVPKKGEKVLEGTEPAVDTEAQQPEKKPTDFAEADSVPVDIDALDALVMAEREQWQPVMEPMVEPLRQLFAQAKAQGLTAGQLLDQLVLQVGFMDADPLAVSLTNVATTARLAGEAGLANE